MPEFPRDEFDAAAEQRGPVGAHRAKASILPLIAMPVLLLLVGGALGYGYVVFLWRQQGNEGLPPLADVSPPVITETVAATPTDGLPTVTMSASPSPSPSPSETAEPVRYDAAVVVLNAAKISGLAGTNADKLTAAGFTAATAGNLSEGLPSANTVRYADAAFQATAVRVAEVLGIAAVEQGTTPQGNISVILVTNPDA